MKAEASFILNKAAINKIDGTEARHYSELAEEAARNAERDAERAEEVAQEMESLDGRLDSLEETVGDSSAGLVKDIADAQGDITSLETTVGDATAGLVKDVSDLIDLAADMMTDIAGLEAVKNAPIYSTADNKLQLYDILNGDIPISFDDTEFIEITPGAYETTYPFRIDSYYTNLSSWSYAYATIKNASATSKYYIGYMGASPYNKPDWPYIWNQGAGEFVVIEYNPNGEFSFNEISLGDAAAGLNLGWIKTGPYISYAYLSIISMSNTDSGNFRIVHVRIECVGMNAISAGDYGVRGIRKYASDGSVENAYWPTVISYTDYMAADALEALDFSAAIPQKDMKEFYVADTIYNPVDSQARSDISDLSDLAVDIMNDITALKNAISTGDTNLKGSEPPTAAQGANGAIYTMTKTVNSVDYVVVFVKTNGTWVPVSNNIPKPESWEDVQTLVTNGLHLYVFKIGEQLTCKKGTETLTWDIVDMDNPDTLATNNWSHHMALCLHETYADMAFDAREAFYYTEEGLTAGIYNFTMGAQSWYSEDVGKTFQFELTQDVPAGGQLVMLQSYNTTAVGASIKSYASGSDITEIETATMSEGSGGISLGTITNAKQTAFNSCQRALMGNNNYKESNNRIWLNSDAAAGSVYSPQNIFDRPSSVYTATAGFKSNIDSDFLAVLTATTCVTARNTVTDGGSSDTTTDIFFLLSREQVFSSKEVSSINEGAQMEYFKTATNRVKYKGSTAKYWWLRTPNASNANNVRYVNTSGALNNNNANNTNGVVPACNIASTNQ